jgi:hypothetical protein
LPNDERLERLVRVEERVQELRDDLRELKMSHRDFKKTMYQKLDTIQRDLTEIKAQRAANSLSWKYKGAILASLISSVGLIVSKLIELIS